MNFPRYNVYGEINVLTEPVYLVLEGLKYFCTRAKIGRERLTIYI